MARPTIKGYRGRLNFFLSELTKKEFKAACSRRGLEMSYVLQKFCDDFVLAYKQGLEAEVEKYLCKGAV